MTKFKVGDVVSVKMPGSFGTSARILEGVVLFSTLQGRWPVLVKVKDGENEMCIQTSADGNGVVSHPKQQFISYVFADGTATGLKPESEARLPGNKAAVAAVFANQRDDGSFTNFRLRNIEEEDEDKSYNDGDYSSDEDASASEALGDEFPDLPTDEEIEAMSPEQAKEKFFELLLGKDFVKQLKAGGKF